MYYFNDIKECEPYKGQIVEIIIKCPAIYEGKNEFGVPLFDKFENLETVIYWTVPTEQELIRKVQAELLSRKRG